MRTIRDYQDDINSWPDGPGKQKLIDLVYRLKGRRLESSPDGTWGGTVEFAAIAPLDWWQVSNMLGDQCGS